MRKVNQENETKKNEDCRANESDIISPKDEEAIRDEKGNNHQQKPEQDLGTPPAGKDERRNVEQEILHYPFCIAARLSLDSVTPMRDRLKREWKRNSAKQRRWT